MNEQDFRNLKTGSLVMFLKSSDESDFIQKIPAGTLMARKPDISDCEVADRRLMNFEFNLGDEVHENFFYADEVQLVKEGV